LSELSKRRIEELIRELALLKKTRDRLDIEAHRWVEKRNAAREQIKKLKNEANSLREKRDILNEEVRKLKILREQAREERNEKQKEILTIEEKIKSIIKRKPSRDMYDIQRDIEDIEWKIQTTPLTLKEEKTLVDRVRILEAQLSIHKQLQKLSERLTELKVEKESLGVKAKLHHERLSELAEQSRSFHEEMIEILKKVRAFQAEANGAHQKYVETSQRSQEFRQKRVELLCQVKSLKQDLRQAEEERKVKLQLDLKKKMTEKALEKLKSGEKLSWEEFKILAEQGIV